jgi:hypothetical protein
LLLNFEKKQPKIPYTYTYAGIANLFSKRRAYLDVAPACSTDALFLSPLYKVYNLVSGFMVGPQMDYKHKHLMSLTGFFKSFIAKKRVHRVRGQITPLIP